jgi:hypothetical protein
LLLERYLDLLSQRQVVVPVVAGKTKKQNLFLFSVMGHCRTRAIRKHDSSLLQSKKSIVSAFRFGVIFISKNTVSKFASGKLRQVSTPNHTEGFVTSSRFIHSQQYLFKTF